MSRVQPLAQALKGVLILSAVLFAASSIANANPWTPARPLSPVAQTHAAVLQVEGSDNFFEVSISDLPSLWVVGAFNGSLATLDQVPWYTKSSTYTTIGELINEYAYYRIMEFAGSPEWLKAVLEYSRKLQSHSVVLDQCARILPGSPSCISFRVQHELAF